MRALVALVVCASLSAAGPAGAVTVAATGADDAVRSVAIGQAAGAQAGAQPETADEYLAALRDLNGSAALDAYGEFEVIRVQAVASVQVGEFTGADAERTGLVLELLRSFNETYTLLENGSREASLERANETAELVEQLRDAGSTENVALASLALDRFYRDVGERFNERAEATNRTPDRAALKEQAARAYREAGAIERYTELTVTADELRATYEDDVATVNGTLNATGEFLDGCEDACSSPVGALTAFGPGVFDRYREARSLGFRLTSADALAEKHALADLESTIADEYTGPTASARTTLAIGSTILVLAYALVVGAVAGLVATRLVKWERDVTASRVGEIVSAGGVR